MLLSDVYGMYEQDKRIMGYSQHTLKAYSLQINLLIRSLGNVDVNDVTTAMLKEYLASQDHLKPASLGHRVRFLRSFFRWAMDEGIAYSNPSSKLKEPKIGARVPKAMSEEEIEMLRDSCETAMERALIEFLYSSGCRIGEVHLANKSDIDWSNKSLVVWGKGSKEREVYFNTRCSVWLKKYVTSRTDEDSALFVTERNPRHRASIAQLRYVVKRVAKRSEISTNIYPHRYRHSYATHLLNNGAPLEVIQSFLGHAKLDTTRLYAQLSGRQRKQQYERYF